MALSNETIQKFIAIAENLKRLGNSSVPFREIYLANNMRIESREDGVWIVDGEDEVLLYDKDRGITTVTKADNAGYAERAFTDGEGRTLKGIDIQEHGDGSYCYAILYDGQMANYGVVDGSFEVELPDEYSLGYTSTLLFTTPSYVDDYYFSTSETVYFKGDNTSDGEFTPEADTRYTIKFEYDGVNIVGYVGSVPAV